jgi:hypothetical protein
MTKIQMTKTVQDFISVWKFGVFKIVSYFGFSMFASFQTQEIELAQKAHAIHET